MWTTPAPAPSRSSLARGVALAAVAVLAVATAAAGTEVVTPAADTVAAPAADRPVRAAEPVAAQATATATPATTAARGDTEEAAVPTPTAAPPPTAEAVAATPEPTATPSSEKPTASPSPDEPTATPSTEAASSSGSSCDLQCRGERILAMAPLVAPSSYTVEFRAGRDGYLGMTHGSSREIIIWVRDDLSDRQVAATLLHEIGHAYDFVGLGGRGDDARRRWADARGFDWDGRDAWFGNGCSSCSDYSIGAGDLAESVHACWAPGWDTFRSQLAGPPTGAQCDLLDQLLR